MFLICLCTHKPAYHQAGVHTERSSHTRTRMHLTKAVSYCISLPFALWPLSLSLLSVCLSVSFSLFCFSVCLSLSLSLCLPVVIYIYIYIYIHTHVHICFSLSLSLSSSVRLSVCLYFCVCLIMSVAVCHPATLSPLSVSHTRICTYTHAEAHIF